MPTLQHRRSYLVSRKKKLYTQLSKNLQAIAMDRQSIIDIFVSHGIRTIGTNDDPLFSLVDMYTLMGIVGTPPPYWPDAKHIVRAPAGFIVVPIHILAGIFEYDAIIRIVSKIMMIKHAVKFVSAEKASTLNNDIMSRAVVRMIEDMQVLSLHRSH